jgi:predicted TIM-barrel fold metal-dependent hydrolase
MRAYQVISADSHAIEPPDLWQKYLPAAYAGRGPRVTTGVDGDEWVCEGLPRRPARRAMGAVARDEVRARAAAERGSTRYETDPGDWDPDRRVEYMDRDGVDAEVLYPNYAMRVFAIPDRALQWNACLAYNDWLADFCRAHPTQLLGIAVVPALDVDRAVKEARRARDRGMVGVLLPQDTPDGSRYSHPKWDPLWAALAEMEMPVSLHIIASGHASANWARDETGEDNAGVAYAVLPVRMARAFGTFILEGVFDRHPGLRLVSAENELSWAAGFLRRLDWGYHRQRMAGDRMITCKRLPTEYWRENCHMTFIDDRDGIRLRESIGVDRIMWSSDFPHLDSSWPESRRFLDTQLADIPDAERRQIVAENCARLYHLDTARAGEPVGTEPRRSS